MKKSEKMDKLQKKSLDERVINYVRGPRKLGTPEEEAQAAFLRIQEAIKKELKSGK